jgi:hypothetical protein
MAMVLGAVVLSTSGCGDVPAQRPANHHPVDGPPYTRAEMIDELELHPAVDPETNTSVWETRTRCMVHKLLPTRRELRRYADAMWWVPTTPNGAAGVVLVDTSDECWNDLSARLQRLEAFH